MTDEQYGDPTTHAFWSAAREHRFLIQHCSSCSRYQFYPRPYCLACMGEVVWVEASGDGTVYSKTNVQVEVPGFTPPYDVAIVQLDEGPRLMTHLLGGEVPIGGRVRIDWRERPDGLPPLYAFVAARTALGDQR